MSPKPGIFVKKEDDLSWTSTELDVKCLQSSKYEIMTQVKNMGIFKNKDDLKDYILKNFIMTNFKYDYELMGFPKIDVKNAMGFAIGKDCKIYGISAQEGKVYCDLTLDQLEKAIIYDNNDVMIVDLDSGKVDRNRITYKRLDPRIEQDIEGLSKYVTIAIYDEDIPAMSMEVDPNIEHKIPTWEGQKLNFVACAKYCNLILPIDIEFKESSGYLKKVYIKMKKYINPTQKIGAVMVGQKSKLISLDENEYFDVKDHAGNVHKIYCNGGLIDLPKGVYSIVDGVAEQYINGFVVSNCPDIFLLFDEETWLQRMKEEPDYDGGNGQEFDSYVYENMVKLDSDLVKNTGDLNFNEKNSRILLDGIRLKDKKLYWLGWELKKGEPLTDTFLRELTRLKNNNDNLAIAVDVMDSFDINVLYHVMSPVVDEFVFKISKMESAAEVMQSTSVLPNYISFMSSDPYLIKDVYKKYPKLVYRIDYQKVRNANFDIDCKKKVITLDGPNDKYGGFGGNAFFNNKEEGSNLMDISEVYGKAICPSKSGMVQNVDITKVINDMNKLKRKAEKINGNGKNHTCSKKKCLPKKLV